MHVYVAIKCIKTHESVETKLVQPVSIAANGLYLSRQQTMINDDFPYVFENIWISVML